MRFLSFSMDRQRISCAMFPCQRYNVIYSLVRFIGFAKYKQRIADDLCVCVLGKLRIHVKPDLLCLMVG